MNPKLQQIAATLRRAFDGVGAWVAGFTFWRFVLLSLLVLIAASAVGDLFHTSQPTHHVTVTAKAKATPDAPVPPTPAAKGETKRNKDGCSEDVRVDWTGVHVKRDCNGKAETSSPSSADTEVTDTGEPDTLEEVITEETKNVGLSDVALAILAVLWVVWFVRRARRKAEARADVAEAEALRASCDRQVAEARLQALQAQVEPHFLFNTLGAVEHLIETDPPRAAEMQRHLIAFLRGAMPRMRGETVTLGEEVELCRNYLAIMKIRMEDRLDFQIDLPDELASAPFPPMMLQSVVENAIKHGLEPKAEGGSIWISARAAAGRLRVAVADSGLGYCPPKATTSGTGIGLNNIRERLTTQFGGRAALVISPNAPTGTQITIEVPHDGESTDGGYC
jgi:hypothetical protein